MIKFFENVGDYQLYIETMYNNYGSRIFCKLKVNL